MAEEAGLVGSLGDVARDLEQAQEFAFSFFAEGVDERVLLPMQFVVEEAIFGIAHIEVRLASRHNDIDLDGLIDQPASLSLHHKYLHELRHFSGIVMEAERGDSGHRHTFYRLVLMPSLARLDHGSDCRIFQGQSVPEIVSILLKEQAIEDVEWQIVAEHEKREFLVCYRETHLGFIERILAEEGIFYYFRHEARGKCTLVISDNPDDLPDCPGQSHLEYAGIGSTVRYGVHCFSLKHSRRLRSTSYQQRDYNFKHPSYNQDHQEDLE